MKQLSALIVALSVLTMSGCAAEGIREAQSANRNVTVDLLTEFEGVRVYRFLDGGNYVYVAVSASQLRAEWQKPEGKTTVRAESLTVQAVK